jgi:hypothetical protein
LSSPRSLRSIFFLDVDRSIPIGGLKESADSLLGTCVLSSGSSFSPVEAETVTKEESLRLHSLTIPVRCSSRRMRCTRRGSIGSSIVLNQQIQKSEMEMEMEKRERRVSGSLFSEETIVRMPTRPCGCGELTHIIFHNQKLFTKHLHPSYSHRV